MDLSKLPKLSDTQRAEGPVPAETEPQQTGPSLPAAPVYRPPGIGADIWISLVIGILLCALGRSFFSFSVAALTHQPYHTGFTWDSDGPKGHAGDEIAYFDLAGETAWSDMGIFLFGLVLLFEAASKTLVMLKPGKPARAALTIAIAFTVIGVLLNVVVCIRLFNSGTVPMLSGFAVAFGGWILIDEWNTLKRSA